MHILIVDDEEHIRYAMIRILEHAGHSTCWAATGEGALKLLRTEPIDLMLLDMMLPDRNGWEVRRDQMSDPALAKVPVIVISALDAENVRAQATVNPMASVQLVMTKPIDVQKLLRAISHIEALGKLQQD